MKQTLTRKLPTEFAYSKPSSIELVRLANEVWGSTVARQLWLEMELPLPTSGPSMGVRTSASISLVRQFCEERLIHDDAAMIGAGKLHSELCSWLESKSLETISATILGRCLRQLGFVRVKSDRIFYRGITLRTSPLATNDTEKGPNYPVQKRLSPQKMQ
jgi:hypothetical protein